MSDRSIRSDLRLFLRAFELAEEYRLHLIGVLFVGLVATPLALLTPIPLKIAVDNILGAQPIEGPIAWLVPGFARDGGTTTLFWVAVLVLVIAFLTQARNMGDSLLQTFVGEKLVLDFRSKLFEHSKRLSLAYHDKKGTWDAIYRIQYDATSIQSLALNGLIPVVSSLFTLAGMIYVTARLDLQLALVALAATPVLATLTVLYRRRLRPQWRKVKKLESAGLSVVQEVMTGLRLVKAFGQEEREQNRFVERYREGLVARVRVMASEGAFGLSTGLTIAAGTSLVLFIGVRNVQSGTLTLGELLLVLGYLSQLYAPLKTLGSRFAKTQNALASAERAFSLLDATPRVRERPSAISLDRSQGALRLENVSFSYDDDTAVLQGITFSAAPGARVGIAGPTGAGKTTLISLLTRLYDPDEGRIFLDGVDLRDYRLQDLREQFGIVLQDTMLFSTSIAENIAYARPGASLNEIREAAQAANIDTFIQSLSEGYHTQVGERGMRLSGGERQRVALARAFLKDAPILILDEPTSSVDIDTEAGILTAMKRLMKDRTTIMIAHRLSTLEACDTLLLLQEGRLVTVTSSVSEAISEAEATGRLSAISATTPSSTAR